MGGAFLLMGAPNSLNHVGFDGIHKHEGLQDAPDPWRRDYGLNFLMEGPLSTSCYNDKYL
jgi:hypothetical protein